MKILERKGMNINPVHNYRSIYLISVDFRIGKKYLTGRITCRQVIDFWN